MKINKLLMLALLLSGQAAMAQMPDSVKRYIDRALYLMQTKSLFAKKLHWKPIRDTAYEKAAGARSYKEAFPAIAYAFQQLKDYHGMVANEDTFYRYPSPVNFDKVLSPGIKKAFLKGPRIVTAVLPGRVAYLRVPGMNVTKQQDIDDRANKLRDSLCRLLQQDPTGIIIDLRMNTGGNIAPMASGLGPLFSGTVLGYGVDRDGKLLAAARMDKGILLDDQGKPMVTVKNSCTAAKNIRIAVLIGPSTVSSGEILATYFKPQANVRLFGQHTPGFLNATEGFPFMNGQGYLLLSVNRVADRRKHVYQDMMLRPHTLVKSEDNYDLLEADPTVMAALKWLK